MNDEKTDMNQVTDKANFLVEKWAKVNCVVDELLASAYENTQYGGNSIEFNEIKGRARDLFGLELTDDEIEIECEERIASDPFILEYYIDEWDDESIGKYYDLTLGFARVKGGIDWFEDEEFEASLYDKEMELYEAYVEKHPMSYSQESHTLILPNGKKELFVYTERQAQKLYDDMVCDKIINSKEYLDFEKKETMKMYDAKLENEYGVNITDIASKYRLLSKLKLDCTHYIESLENGEDNSKRWLVDESVNRHFDLISDLIQSLPDEKIPNGFDNATMNDLRGKVEWNEYCYSVNKFVEQYNTFIKDFDFYEWQDQDLENNQEYEKMKSKQIQDIKEGKANYLLNYLKDIKNESIDDLSYEDEEMLRRLINEYETLEKKAYLFMDVKEFVEYLDDVTLSQEETVEEDEVQL